MREVLHLHEWLPGKHADPWERIALWGAIGITTATLFCFGGVYSTVWAPAALCALALACLLLWRSAAAGPALHAHPLLWSMLGFGGMVAVQWLFGLTVYGGATLTGLCQLAAAGAVFFLAVVAFQDARNVTRFATIAWVLAGVLGILAILEFFTAGKNIYWYHNADYATPVGPFVYHNHFAGAMDLLLPLAVVAAFRRDRTGDSPWIGWVRRGLLPAFAFVAVVLSVSRGGMITLAFEALLAVALVARQKKRLIFPLVIAAAVFFGFSVLVDWSPMIERFVHLGSRDVSWFDRLAVGRSCLHIFKEHLWLGSGFNTFEYIYPHYQTFDSGQIFAYAHDEYAQMLAETGLAGAAAIVAFLVAFFRLALPRQTDAATYAARIRTAAFISCLGLMFHSFGDFEFHAPAIAFLFFVVAAAATAPVENVVRQRRVAVESPAKIESPVAVVHRRLTPVKRG